MTEQTLFGEIEVSPPAVKREMQTVERRRKAKLAYAHTSESWKRATYSFAVESFLPSHETFMFEELTTAYEDHARTHRLPLSVEKRAFAGLQRILVNEGKIELIKGVTRVRSNGQAGLVYRSNF